LPDAPPSLPDVSLSPRSYHGIGSESLLILISDKQRGANCRNAQQSSGSVSSHGKQAVRLNALTYGLRARDFILPWEDPEEYKQLWDDLLAALIVSAELAANKPTDALEQGCGSHRVDAAPSTG